MNSYGNTNSSFDSYFHRMPWCVEILLIIHRSSSTVYMQTNSDAWLSLLNLTENVGVGVGYRTHVSEDVLAGVPQPIQGYLLDEWGV